MFKEEEMQDNQKDNNPPTVLVEVSGGLVTNVATEEPLPIGTRIIVRDHDNLKVDPNCQDEEWLLGMDETASLVKKLSNHELADLAVDVVGELETRDLSDPSYIEGYKAGFIAALRDENWGPGQVWTDEEKAELFKEIERWFGLDQTNT